MVKLSSCFTGSNAYGICRCLMIPGAVLVSGVGDP